MAVLCLLEIKGIAGESLNSEHRNTGFTQPGQLRTGAASAAGGVSVQDVAFTDGPAGAPVKTYCNIKRNVPG